MATRQSEARRSGFCEGCMGVRLVTFLIPCAGLCETPGGLPAGQYQYFGKSGKSTPKLFSINDDGAIHWDDVPEAMSKGNDLGATESKSTVAAAEEYDYPLVKWKGRHLQGGAKATGWLTTTYESGGVKYQVTVEVESGFMQSHESVIKTAKKKGLTVELLDANGFKIAELVIPGYVLHETSNSSVIEGRGAIPMPEPLYQKTRNISIR